MNQSRNSGKVSNALAKAQAEFGLFVVDKAGYNFKYLTLGKMLEVALPILGKHNVSLIQDSGVEVVGEEPWIKVTTRVSCEEEWVESTLSFPMIIPTKKTDTDIAMLGSTISYLRRYALQSMLGIAGSDTDVEEMQDEETKFKNNGE